MKAIQNELGGSSARADASEMKEKILAKQMPEVAEKEALRQLARLERGNDARSHQRSFMMLI